MISKPFGGYNNILEIDDIHLEDPILPHSTKELLKVSYAEERLNLKFNSVVGAFGMQNTRWGRLAIVLFLLWTMCTSIVCFMKPDFLNLTIGMIGLFMFLDPQQIKQSYLRLMVAVFPLCQIYDIVWLWTKHNEYYND